MMGLQTPQQEVCWVAEGHLGAAHANEAQLHVSPPQACSALRLLMVCELWLCHSGHCVEGMAAARLASGVCCSQHGAPADDGQGQESTQDAVLLPVLPMSNSARECPRGMRLLRQ
jgi:hypothetical protein